jgi:cytochrome P450
MTERRLRQGSAAWPAHHGVTGGPFADWWSESVLSLEGWDHARLRKLVTLPFSRKLISAMAPSFRDLATELIDGFADTGRCEFVSAFAEPYATRVPAAASAGTRVADVRVVRHDRPRPCPLRRRPR